MSQTIAPHHDPAAMHPPRIVARDTGIDLVRALCVAGVVILHAMMVGVTVADGRPVFENASEGSAWIAPLSWVLQVMPLFFVIGGFSGLLSYRAQRARGARPAEFVAARLQRLLRPAVFAVGSVGAALALLAIAGTPPDIVGIAAFRYSQPLWFLGVFLLCQALLPMLASAHRRAPLTAIVALAGGAIVVDALRAVTGIPAVGFLNLAFVWMTLQQLGFFLADGAIDRLRARTRLIAGASAVSALLVAWVLGVYSPDLIESINPPTAALLLVGIAHTCALSLLRNRLHRVSRRPLVAGFSAFVTRRTMTIYLWHMPVLLGLAGVSAAFALMTGVGLPEPSSPAWWLGRPLWLAVALGATALVAARWTRIETAPAPAVTGSRRRILLAVLTGLLAVVLLLIFGTTPLVAAMACVLMMAALRAAQASPRTATLFCGHPTGLLRGIRALGPRTSLARPLG